MYVTDMEEPYDFVGRGVEKVGQEIIVFINIIFVKYNSKYFSLTKLSNNY